MEHPADESAVQKISLYKPEQTPTKKDLDAPETPKVACTQFVGFRCQIPSLWKRFGAEFIDFILLYLIKYVLSDFVIDIIVGIDLYICNEILLQYGFNMDYPSVVVVVLSYILFVLDVSYRILFFIIEIYCTQETILFYGGGTIGKHLLGLTIVRADKLYNIQGQPNDNIALTPGSGLGWKNAILRSLAKNLFFSLMFPLAFITAAANQNRCVYDVMFGTIVVEVLQPLRCDQSKLIPIT